MKEANKAEIVPAAQVVGANPQADEFFNDFKAEWERMAATPEVEVKPRRVT